jgi:hypothetical protein
MKVNRRYFVVTVAILVLLAGCSGTGLNPDRYLANKQTFMLNQGNPPAYVDGYIDGCSAGRRLAGDKGFNYKKNSTRFERDALYARGWQEGEINCRNESLEESIRSAQNKEKKVTSPPIAEPCPPVKTQTRAEELEMQRMWEDLKK